jgi:hypothetical protein
MKRLFLIVVTLALACALGAQSLAELSKREKARRESLKGQRAAVVTNLDLLRVKKTTAVEVVPPEAEGDIVLEGEDPQEAQETGLAEGQAITEPSGSGAPSGRRIVPRVGQDGPVITADANRDMIEPGGTLEAQLEAAKQMVDLLTTKMNALRQQFEYQDAMVPGYVIQKQLDDTNQRLLKAQAQMDRIEALVEKKAPGRKTPGQTER